VGGTDLDQLFVFTNYVVPRPRPPQQSEKTYRTVDHVGNLTEPEPLPCWYDELAKKMTKAYAEGRDLRPETEIEPPEVFMTVVVPAYNEEKRLMGMLEEAVNYLETEYGTSATAQKLPPTAETTATPNGDVRSRKPANGTAHTPQLRGWEILLINDGSTDGTLSVCTNFCQDHILPALPRRMSGPWTHRSEQGVKIKPGSIRMVTLTQNRGKGGAVTHGMRHARGQYVVFADADGASQITDLGKLVSACEAIQDSQGRGVAVGSRNHLVGSEAVVKRSKLRNFLMHSFHLLLWVMTPPATGRIKDTQCGFKLFSRASLPYIVPYMHTEGWIFDVEMLMLAEFAGIPVAEVAIGWREVVGSKLNVLWDSIGMAWGLAVLRFCWGVGVFRR
jgi:dolichyl-phosphate beta-glucosyltransferase